MQRLSLDGADPQGLRRTGGGAREDGSDSASLAKRAGRGVFSMASQSVAPIKSIPAFIPELEGLIGEAMEGGRVPGLAVGVVQNGEVAFVRPYGLRDVEAGLKVTADPQFQLMSVSKPFTA